MKMKRDENERPERDEDEEMRDKPASPHPYPLSHILSLISYCVTWSS
jgi:hypothetical protein